MMAASDNLIWYAKDYFVNDQDENNHNKKYDLCR